MPCARAVRPTSKHASQPLSAAVSLNRLRPVPPCPSPQSKAICDPRDENGNFKSAARAQADGTTKASLIDCFTMCAMPHGVAILVVIAGTFLTGFAICYVSRHSANSPPFFTFRLELGDFRTRARYPRKSPKAAATNCNVPRSKPARSSVADKAHPRSASL